MANNIEKQLKEISERLEQGVKEIFTSERYTEYLNTMSKFHNYLGFMTPKAFENANLDPEKTYAFTYKNTTFYSTWIKKS